MAVTLQGILQAAFAGFAQAQRVPKRVWQAAQAVRQCRTAALGGPVRCCPHGQDPVGVACQYIEELLDVV